MLSLLTPKHSDQVGGPIGSMREAKKVESYPNYDAAYLAKRLGAANPTALLTNRYDTTRAGLNGVDELVYKQNAVKGYEAEAEECLKKEFKDWLEGKHMDNLVPHTHDNAAGGGVRRDMHGKIVNNWIPTWWGPNQLTYLPGVREYLREQAIRADKNSLDMNVLAHLGPQNLEEAWAYFKHWVKGRPVGPEECLQPSPLHPSNIDLPNRAGPIHMQHDTRLHPDRPYNAITGLPPWPGGGGGGGGFWPGGPPGPPPGPPPDDDDDDDDGDLPVTTDDWDQVHTAAERALLEARLLGRSNPDASPPEQRRMAVPYDYVLEQQRRGSDDPEDAVDDGLTDPAPPPAPVLTPEIAARMQAIIGRSMRRMDEFERSVQDDTPGPSTPAYMQGVRDHLEGEEGSPEDQMIYLDSEPMTARIWRTYYNEHGVPPPDDFFDGSDWSSDGDDDLVELQIPRPPPPRVTWADQLGRDELLRERQLRDMDSGATWVNPVTEQREPRVGRVIPFFYSPLQQPDFTSV